MDHESMEKHKTEWERTEPLQFFWDVTTNIIGYSLIVASIILGLYLDYWGSTAYTLFCISAVVYFFSKYYYYPHVANDRSNTNQHERKTFLASTNFTSFLGNGEVLYGGFGDLFGEGGKISYCFISLCYIPLIPIGCYHFYGNRKMIQITSDKILKDSKERDAYWLDRITWNWKEILYIYLKNWSFAVMVITVINTIMWDYVNPAIYG